jgi:hypothetical protein
VVHTVFRKHLQFALFSLAILLFYHKAPRGLAVSAFGSDLHFYIMVVLIGSGYLFYSARGRAFSNASYSHITGALVLASGCALCLAGRQWRTSLSQNDIINTVRASLLIVLVRAFVFFYRTRTYGNLAFPICFLLLMVPLSRASVVLEARLE